MTPASLPSGPATAFNVFHVVFASGRRHGFLSGGTNRQQVANLSPKYRNNRKRHRIWAVLFSNLERTSPPEVFTGGDASPPSPPSPPPLSTPMVFAIR